MKRTRQLALLGLVGAVGVATSRQRRLLQPAAPELRTPLAALPLPPLTDRTLPALRPIGAGSTEVAAGVEVRTVTLTGADGNSVRVLVYEAPDRRRPSGALVWTHGGGYVMGTPEAAHAWCSAVARDTGAVVVNVDYRLAPEHPFPAGLNDAFTALEWVHAEAATLGVDPARVAVGGDSAGGGMAAALAQMAHDRGGVPVCLQLLVYPMLDDRTATRPVTALVWNNRSNAYAWGAYLGHPAGQAEDRPWAVPARRDDLGGLPPAWIGVGDIDLFHDEDVAYAQRLRDAGVACDLHVEPGMYHAADALRPATVSMRAFRMRMIAALQAAFAVPSPSR